MFLSKLFLSDGFHPAAKTAGKVRVAWHFNFEERRPEMLVSSERPPVSGGMTVTTVAEKPCRVSELTEPAFEVRSFSDIKD
jgi:hypothetical protein